MRTLKHAMVVTCKSQGSHALKQTLLYCLYYPKWNHNVQNGHCSVLKKKLETSDRHELIRKPFTEVKVVRSFSH